MPDQIEIRYRCVVCAGPVTMGHLAFAAMVNAAVTDHLRGFSNIPDDGDYIAFVCTNCQENPETGATIAAMPWSKPEPHDTLDALEADRLGVPYP